MFDDREITPALPDALLSVHALVPSAERVVELFFEQYAGNTLIAYRADLEDFAGHVNAPSAANAMAAMLAGGHGPANARVLAYRANMLVRKLASATINRRLAAVRACVRLARMIGVVSWTIDVAGLKVVPYRDTAGPGTDGVAKLLAATEHARDRAIVRLLFDLALRRVEVHRLDLDDVDLKRRKLLVLGKGHREKISHTIPRPTLAALRAWLNERPPVENRAVFIALDRAHFGARLSGSSIYNIVRDTGESVGVRARPHGLRHAAITEALEKRRGNVRDVQRFSRHADSRTVQHYDDERRDIAGEVAEVVAKALDAAGQ